MFTGVEAVKQLQSLPKDDVNETQIKAALKQCFSALMTHEEEDMKSELEKLVEKVKSGAVKSKKIVHVHVTFTFVHC